MTTDASDDYYALLGIEADADGVKLRRAFWQLALRWHPDRAGPDATARFQRISAAYAVLSDPIARAAYDGGRGPDTNPAGRTQGAPRTSARRRAPGVMLSRLSGPLKALLTCGIARRAGGDVIEIFLSLEEAAQGGMVAISMRVPVRCSACTGWADPSCPRCSGQGTVEELYTAWLAVPPEVADRTVLTPSEMLRGMLRPVRFRMRVRAGR